MHPFAMKQEHAFHVMLSICLLLSIFHPTNSLCIQLINTYSRPFILLWYVWYALKTWCFTHGANFTLSATARKWLVVTVTLSAFELKAFKIFFLLRCMHPFALKQEHALHVMLRTYLLLSIFHPTNSLCIQLFNTYSRSFILL